MTEATARFQLPLLQSGQAQKEMTHNEAMTMLDLTCQASVVASGTNEPPATPEPGQCWVIGPTPVGSWTGQAGMLAGWTAGGWRFVVPGEGFVVWNQASGTVLRRSEGAWLSGVVTGERLVIGGHQVVGVRQPAITGPAGGSTVDAEARAALTAVLAALRGHGLIEG